MIITAKTYSRYTKDKGRGIKEYQLTNQLAKEDSKRERKEKKKEIQNSRKQHEMASISLYLLTINFKCEMMKLSNQKAESA